VFGSWVSEFRALGLGEFAVKRSTVHRSSFEVLSKNEKTDGVSVSVHPATPEGHALGSL
jgi:hypothetical protein